MTSEPACGQSAEPETTRIEHGPKQERRQPDPEFWAGRRVVVTGGTGFLGWHLVQVLRQMRARLRTLALHPSLRHPILDLDDIEPVFGDVTDSKLVESVLSDAEIIFHAAGPVAIWGVAPNLILQTHIQGTANVLRYAPENAKIVYTSSVTTIGATRTAIVLDEENSLIPSRLQIPYIEAKREAERLCLEAAKTDRWVVVVNPGYLIGPDDFGPSILGRFCQRFWKGRVWLVPRGGINVVDVRDVAIGHLLAVEHGRPGRRYILGGENLSFLQFCYQLSAVAHCRPRFLSACPAFVLNGCAAVAHLRSWWTRREPYPSLAQIQIGTRFWYYTSQRAYAELGYSARPISETLQDTWFWYQQYHRPVLKRFTRWWMRAAA
jgi:dihydroflavonol-4-reductase